MNQVIAHAPAKINLVLDVEPLRAGEEKHRLSSIFCTTSLLDTLVFDFAMGSEPFNAQVKIETADSSPSFVKEHDNTLIKVVEQFKLAYGFGFLPPGTLNVQLIKSIPTQAGLGGGSSDAAAMLRMLCWLAQVEPLSEKSLSVARAVGADVPFFLHAPKAGFCALMGGYGDELLSDLPKPQLHLVLVKPAFGVSTKKAYEVFDSRSTADNNPGASERLAQALNDEASAPKIAALCANNLESAAIEILPEIGSLKKELSSLPGVLGATLSGSGSALFAICESPTAAQESMQHFAKQDLWSVAVET
ncbi:MAG: hypothetical protein FWE41_06205 [Coriobacteriia bacterium]|nr:hypothetical protein [Coriobacteriia bacterium]MCL2750395.1 hypothetical protein [Coriobacteriia bacterium]